MKGLLFTYVLTYGGAAASLFNPFIGLLVYICFAVLKPEQMWHWSVPEGNYSRIVALALLFSWAMRGCGTWQFGKATRSIVALLSFLGVAIFGSLVSAHPEVAWISIDALLKIVLPFLVGVTTMDSVAKL